MTITTPRRSVRSLGRMTQADERAWWDTHPQRYTEAADRAETEARHRRGDFSPVRPCWSRSEEQDGLSVVGSLDHHVSGDGWGRFISFEVPTHHEVEVDEDGVRTQTRSERSFTTRTLRDGTTVRRCREGGAQAFRTTERPEGCDHLTLTERQLEGDPIDRRQWLSYFTDDQEAAPRGAYVGDLSGPSTVTYSGSCTGTLTEPIDYRREFLSDLSRRPERGEGGVHYDVTVSRGRASWATTTIDDAMMSLALRSGVTLTSTEDRDVREAGRDARIAARHQMARYGQLRQSTRILGEAIPRDMWFDRARGDYAAAHRRIEMHIADAFIVDADSEMTSDELVPDSRRQELMDWSDLMQLLESGGLTPRESEALSERAAGVAQTDRSGAALSAARSRAQRIMAGPIRVTWPRLTRSYCWTEV